MVLFRRSRRTPPLETFPVRESPCLLLTAALNKDARARAYPTPHIRQNNKWRLREPTPPPNSSSHSYCVRELRLPCLASQRRQHAQILCAEPSQPDTSSTAARRNLATNSCPRLLLSDDDPRTIDAACAHRAAT